MEKLQTGVDVFFLLMGAILVFAMHGGFAFLEVGTVRHKNQVNALCKIMVDFAISTVCYFLVGYAIAYGIKFTFNAETISGGGQGFDGQGLSLVKFFFLATFAAAVPAIISGGIAERAKFGPQCVATALIVGLCYPLFEGIIWNKGKTTRDERSIGLKFAEVRGVKNRKADVGETMPVYPTEAHVMHLASCWSFDPTSLEGSKADTGIGYICVTPPSWRPERMRRTA